MKLVRDIVSVVCAIAMAVVFVGAGFAACVAPPATHVLSSVFSKDDISPFDRNQLVKVADATREFSFGNHDELALYQAIYEVDAEYQQKIVQAGGQVPLDFPTMGAVMRKDSVEQYKTAFANASELYCYSPDTVSHLDDCHAIASSAYSILLAFLIAAVASAAFTWVTCGKRKFGRMLFASGVIVLVAFAALGIAAAVNFDGFFTMFHKLFFSQGNWTFPFDSLLICSLPTEFWMGMGAIWLVVTALLSVAAIVVGRKL